MLKPKLTKMDLTTGSIPKKMFLFALPIMFSGILQLLYSAADLVVCSQYGHTENAVGAISETQSISYLIISLFLGFGIGANVAIGRAYGANSQEKGMRTIGSSMALALSSSVILLIIGVTCAKYLLMAINCPSDILDLSATYMRIYFIGIPFLIIFNFGSALLRGMGDTTRPFIYLTASGLINIALNFLFVIVFKLDVAGVAITTVISEFISALLVVLTLILDKKQFAYLSFSHIRFYKEETLDIVHIGLPAGIQSAMFSISNVIIQQALNSFESAAVATGSGSASSIESFLNVSMDSFAQAGVAFISANYGAKKIDNIRKSVLWSCFYGCSVSVIFGAVAYFNAKSLVSIYISGKTLSESDLQTALETGIQRLQIVSSTYIIYAMVDIVSNAERGLGYSTLSMIVSLVGIAGLRLIYIFTIFQLPAYHSIYWLYMTYPISWAITASAHLFCYFMIRDRAFKKCLATAELKNAKESEDNSI
jgi:putative MATE family efflux protein